MNSRVGPTVAAVAAVLMAVTGCAASAPSSVGATSEQFLGELQASLDMADGVYLSNSVIDSLPNARYVLHDGSVVTESDSVVVGMVTSVGDVRGYILNGERVQEAREGDTPMWHLVRVTVAVEESWGAAAGKGEMAVTFPLSSTNSIQSSIDSLLKLGRVLLILDRDRIVHNEEYLGLVDGAGVISYPFITDPAATAGVRTVAEVRAALAEIRDPVPADPLELGD